jgi:hypothetical protein
MVTVKYTKKGAEKFDFLLLLINIYSLKRLFQCPQNMETAFLIYE